MSLLRFFKNPFYSARLSMSELRKYGAAQLAALIADTPAGMSAVVADLTACLAGFDATFPEVIGAGGALAEASNNKKLFRKALTAKIAKIANGIGAAYGDPSSELEGAFPQGRSIFQRCEDVDLLGHLTALKNWFTPARVTAVGAAHQTSINGLVTQWTAIWAALGTAKGELSSDRGTRDEAKLAYQDCLFRVLLNLALKFPNDEAKFAQYVPEHLLEDATPATPPGKPTLTGEFVGSGVNHLDFQAEGAVTYKILFRAEEDPEFSVAAEGIEGNTYDHGDRVPGTYHYKVVAVNAAGESEESDVVTLVVT